MMKTYCVIQETPIATVFKECNRGNFPSCVLVRNKRCWCD